MKDYSKLVKNKEQRELANDISVNKLKNTLITVFNIIIEMKESSRNCGKRQHNTSKTLKG